VILGLRTHALHGLLAGELVGDIGEIAHDRFHVLADITHFGELGGFHLHERRIRQRGQAAGDFGFSHAGGTDHQDVLRRDFLAQHRFQLHAAPAIAQRDGDSALGIVLADDVAIEFVDDFAWSEFGHGV
jgi:hypothetical protein